MDINLYRNKLHTVKATTLSRFSHREHMGCKCVYAGKYHRFFNTIYSHPCLFWLCKRKVLPEVAKVTVYADVCVRIYSQDIPTHLISHDRTRNVHRSTYDLCGRLFMVHRHGFWRSSTRNNCQHSLRDAKNHRCRRGRWCFSPSKTHYMWMRFVGLWYACATFVSAVLVDFHSFLFYKIVWLFS